MQKEELIKRLMVTFLEELEEHVRALNADLLALEKAPAGADRAERFRTLLRTAHSLKGAARSVNVGAIETACHRLEEIFAAARDGRVTLDTELFALLFAVADALEEAGMRLREQPDLDDAPLAELLPRLNAAASGAVPRPEPRKYGIDNPESIEKRASTVAELHATNPTPHEDHAPDLPGSSFDPPSSLLALEPPTPPPDPAPETTAGTVRILAEKLDGLLAQSGELLVGRRRVQARLQDLFAVREQAARLKTEWRIAEKTLNKFIPREGGGTAKGHMGPHGTRERDAQRPPRRAVLALERTRGGLQRLEETLDRLSADLAADSRFLDQAASALDDEVRHARMFPFAEACQGLDRMVRDLAHAGGKVVDFLIVGGAVALDRSVLEGLKDPLRHLVRNAVDHGAEVTSERQAANKSPRAQVTVTAALRGAQVEVQVADDGRGLDLEALRQQVRKRKLPEPADDRELAQTIFLHGLSTTRIITDVSGRGVGLDIVKSRVEALHGTVEVAYTPGQGTRFTLAVPLTLTTLRALLVVAGGQTFAFSGSSVQKLVRAAPGSFRSVEGREMLSLGGTPLPVADLAETLGLPAHAPASGGEPLSAVVVAAGEKRMAFVVDEFQAEQEIVVKSLGARLRRVRHVTGATILPSGRIALLLNTAGLIRSALSQAPARSLATEIQGTAPKARKRILLAEDSVTTRTLEKTILEAAGYQVVAAADGEAAWQLLQERGADLVISDVEMPGRDGFSLTELIRGSKRFAELPVILVTARESEEDRVHGLAVGANAYLLKSAFDQTNLLETIAQLL